MVLGHDISTGRRTQDVRITQDIFFDTLALSVKTVKGLKLAGFLKPSPIQLHGIPLGMCGFDLLLEAKSGTGKTAVFTVIALEKLDLNKGVQSIILAPTREIASQISEVITAIGSQYKDLNVAVVMGGLPVEEDVAKFKKNVHIVVGSPGRLRHLIHKNYIDISSVRLFVLDEADKLMESSFLSDINYIFSLLPKQKQVIMSSATYSDKIKSFISKYVQKAQCVCPDSNQILLGITQKVVTVPHNMNIVHQTKHRYTELLKILNEKQFKQCLIFCNYQVRVGELHRMLTKDKWPAELISAQQAQSDRLSAIKTLQEYKCRILVSTDLTARGIDASNVDIVVNFEPPFEWETYLHRIGRAGRYGAYGIAVTILSEGKETTKFRETLAISKIPFDIRNFWDEEPFTIDINQKTDSPEENEAPVSVSSNIAPQNSQVSDMLWKILTARSTEQDDIKSEISRLDDEHNTFKMSTKPNIESFEDLMHSFTSNQSNTDKKVDSFQFKHVKFVDLPLDHIKCCNSLENGSKKQPKNDCPVVKTSQNKAKTKLINNLTNSHSISEEESDEEAPPTQPLLKCNKVASSKLGCEWSPLDSNTATDHHVNVNKIQNGNENHLEYKLNRSEIDPIKGTLLDADVPTAFGNNKKTKIHSDVSDVENHSSYTEMNANKQNGNMSKNKTQGSICQTRCEANNHYEIDKVELDPMQQDLINAGLPIAFGKNKQNRNNNRLHTTYSNCNGDNDRKNSVECKKKQNQQQNTTTQRNRPHKVEKIRSSETFTKNNYLKQSVTSDESDPSETPSVTSCHKNKTMKLTNNYLTYASTINNTLYHQFETQKPNNRSKQFDKWYNQLKRQTQSIQHALYIEELRKLNF